MLLVIISCLLVWHFKMEQKLKLTQTISLDAFKNHYWLKVELIAFCKDNDLSATGSKQEIIHRIETFIVTGRRRKEGSSRNK